MSVFECRPAGVEIGGHATKRGEHRAKLDRWLGIEWWLARERRLARWGVLAVGDVVAWEGRDGRGRAGPWLRYRFTGPNSEALGGEVKAWPELLLTPRRASEIPILYDPRRPARHRPLAALRVAVPAAVGDPAPINKE